MLNKTLIPFLGTTIITAILHFIFLATELYYTYPLVDILVHTFGGAVIASGVFWLASFVPGMKRPAWSNIFTIILVIGLGWEIWEILIGAADFTKFDYSFDTIKDMVNDTIGASLVWWAYSVFGSKK